MEEAIPIAVGLEGDDAAWESLLESEGLLWQPLRHGPAQAPAPRVVILPAGSKSKAALRLMADGAALIVEPGVDVPAEETRRLRFPFHRRTFAVDERDGLAVPVLKRGLGIAYRLPFALQDVSCGVGVRRQFVRVAHEGADLIWHDQAAVVKRNVRQACVTILRDAFAAKDIPYVHKWYWPHGKISAFCLRGDLDGGPEENLKRFLDAVAGAAFCTTVFACGAYDKRRELLRLADSIGIELGNHTFSHYVFPDRMSRIRDLDRAESMLRDTHTSGGFASPAHFWNEGMYRLLAERGYRYASSFGFDCDNLPYRPVIGGRLSPLIEIPYHCMGDAFPKFALGLSTHLVRDFFTTLIRQKIAAGEFAGVYGHPDMAGRLGEAPDLVRTILDTGLGDGEVWPCQLSDLARWWAERASAAVRATWHPVSRTVRCTTSGQPGCRLRAVEPDGQWRFITLTQGEQQVRLDQFALRAALRQRGPGDIGQIVHREYRPSLVSALRAHKRNLKRALSKYRDLYRGQSR